MRHATGHATQQPATAHGKPKSDPRNAVIQSSNRQGARPNVPTHCGTRQPSGLTPDGPGRMIHALLKAEDRRHAASESLRPAWRKGCEPPTSPSAKRAEDSLSTPILIARRKKRKRIFPESSTFSLGGVLRPAKRGKPLTGAAPAASIKMYLHYCMQTRFGKGKIGESGKKARSSRVRFTRLGRVSLLPCRYPPGLSVNNRDRGSPAAVSVRAGRVRALRAKDRSRCAPPGGRACTPWHRAKSAPETQRPQHGRAGASDRRADWHGLSIRNSPPAWRRTACLRIRLFELPRDRHL